VAHYYQHVRGANSGGLKHFSKLIGQGHSGRTDLSVNYKQYLAESLAAKYKLPGQGGSVFQHHLAVFSATGNKDSGDIRLTLIGQQSAQNNRGR